MSDNAKGNVVSIFRSNKKDDCKKEEKPVENKEESVDTFSEIIRKNAENRDRLKKDRFKSNQKVIRSHRLKH